MLTCSRPWLSVGLAHRSSTHSSSPGMELTWYSCTNWGGSNMTVFIQLFWYPWVKYLMVSLLFWHCDLLEHLLSTLHHPHRGSLLVTQLLQLAELSMSPEETAQPDSRGAEWVSAVRVYQSAHLVTYCSIHIICCWWPAESRSRRRYCHGVE